MTVLRIAMTPQSHQVIARHQAGASLLRAAIGAGIAQGVEEAAVHVKMAKLSGTFTPGTRRDGQTPVALRSGALRQAVIGRQDEPMAGYVGVAAGPASAYARTILSDEETTIEPKNAKHLWIPVADNVTRSGLARITPREAFEMTGPTGKTLLRIFRSRKGNLVAGLAGKVPGVRRKGFKLLFVLKDQVTIKGTDALAEGVQEMVPRIRQILEAGIQGALA